MSIHRDFVAPAVRNTDLSPETIDYHMARAHAVRSQALFWHLSALAKLPAKLHARQKAVRGSEAVSTSYTAHQS